MIFGLEELSNSVKAFSGTVRKIRVVSNGLCYGPCPEPEDVVEQHFTLNDKGHLWLSSYHSERGYGQLEKRRSERKSVSLGTAQRVLKAVGQVFKEFHPMIATDAGTWYLEITNLEGEKFKYMGSLCGTIEIFGKDLSELIRDEVEMPDLLLFDGNTQPDRIEQLKIEYWRHSVLKNKPHTEGASDQTIWDYSESLTIDRETEQIEYKRNIALECNITHTYHVGEGVADLLDRFEPEELFMPAPEAPTDLIEDDKHQRSYTVTVKRKKNPDIVLSGVYDKYGLPENWAEIIDEIWEFISFYGTGGEIVNPGVYGKARRRASDLVFVYVEFDGGSKEYCYLANEDIYAVGDLVDVPVGHEKKLSVAEVTRVVYLPADEAPYPLMKIKYVEGQHK